jgi:acetyl esterase
VAESFPRYMINRLSTVFALLFIVSEFSLAQPLNKFTKIENIEWAKPEGFSLTMDIYTPDTGKSNYPVLIIFHGGGWLINNETIMDQMSRYIVEHSGYVVCNVNYRLLPTSNNTTTLNQMVEDVFGAVLWIKDHIVTYKGDPQKIAVSGDSAGGHLAAMVVTSGHRLESDGFNGNTLGFTPSYLPKGKTAEDVARNNGLTVQAAVLNYPATDIYGTCLGPSGDGMNGFESSSNFFWNIGQATPRGIFGEKINVKNNPEPYKACSPLYNIPNVKERKLPPQFCAVGTKDNLTTPSLVKEYVTALQQAAQPVEYWEHEGRPHAYLDSGSNQYLGISFEKDAPIAIDRIIEFLDKVF